MIERQTKEANDKDSVKHRERKKNARRHMDTDIDRRIQRKMKRIKIARNQNFR